MEFQQTCWVDPVGCRSDILTWVFGASFKHIVYAFTTLTPRVLLGHFQMMVKIRFCMTTNLTVFIARKFMIRFSYRSFSINPVAAILRYALFYCSVYLHP